MAPLFKNKNKQDESGVTYKALTLAEFSDLYVGQNGSPNALKNPVIASIISLITNSVATLPIKVIQETPQGAVNASFTREYKLFTVRPNTYQTPYQFVQTIVSQMLIKGEAFIIKNKSKGEVVGLVPYVEGVTVSFTNGVKVYRLASGQTLTDNEVIHVLHNSLNGITAIDPLGQHRDAIALDNTLRRYAKKYFQNGANPSMYVQVEGAKTQADLESMTAGFEGSFASVENAGKIPFVPKTVEIKTLASNAKEAMLIESLKYSLETLCRIFGLPPSKIGSKEGASYNSLEAENIAFLQNTIQPIVKKIESAFDAGLFLDTPFFVKFNTDAILRSTTIERYNAYRIALGGNGFMTQNEVRDLEDRNPITGGDVVFRMVNVVDVNAPDPNTQGNT